MKKQEVILIVMFIVDILFSVGALYFMTTGPDSTSTGCVVSIWIIAALAMMLWIFHIMGRLYGDHGDGEG